MLLINAKFCVLCVSGSGLGRKCYVSLMAMDVICMTVLSSQTGILFKVRKDDTRR